MPRPSKEKEIANWLRRHSKEIGMDETTLDRAMGLLKKQNPEVFKEKKSKGRPKSILDLSIFKDGFTLLDLIKVIYCCLARGSEEGLTMDWIRILCLLMDLGFVKYRETPKGRMLAVPRKSVYDFMKAVRKLVLPNEKIIRIQSFYAGIQHLEEFGDEILDFRASYKMFIEKIIIEPFDNVFEGDTSIFSKNLKSITDTMSINASEESFLKASIMVLINHFDIGYPI